MAIKIGDWVTTQRKGYWQVYRMLRYSFNNPFTQNEGSVRVVFSKRFVTEKFKRSFSQVLSNANTVKKVDAVTLSQIEKFAQDHDKLFRNFVDYVPKPIDSVYNARIRVPASMTAMKVEALIPKDREFTDADITPYLRILGFDTEGFPCWTVQFVCHDHEVKNKHLVYRMYKVRAS
jgi:hypothetical protein